MTTRRVTFNMDSDLLDVLDSFAAMNDRTRTYVIHELLMPSVPMLKELLNLSKDLSAMSDTERLIALQKMKQTEDGLQEIMNQLPEHIEGISK